VKAHSKPVNVPFYKKRVVHMIVGTILIVLGILLLQQGQ